MTCSKVVTKSADPQCLPVWPRITSLGTASIRELNAIAELVGLGSLPPSFDDIRKISRRPMPPKGKAWDAALVVCDDPVLRARLVNEHQAKHGKYRCLLATTAEQAQRIYQEMSPEICLAMVTDFADGSHGDAPTLVRWLRSVHEDLAICALSDRRCLEAAQKRKAGELEGNYGHISSFTMLLGTAAISTSTSSSKNQLYLLARYGTL